MILEIWGRGAWQIYDPTVFAKMLFPRSFQCVRPHILAKIVQNVMNENLLEIFRFNR
jgi:hypothetical protein